MRRHLQDTALLYSLLEDLQMLWQYKALEWDKLALKVSQNIEQAQRTDIKPSATAEQRLREILEHNSEYTELRDRILSQRQEALDIADFLGVMQVEALKTLTFKQPLPDNPSLENAIGELEKLSRYCERTHYGWQYVRATLHYSFTWLRLAFLKATSRGTGT